MSEKLKPCPFCGGEAEFCIEEHTWPPARVRCSKCGIATQWEVLAIEAAEKWNARAERTCHNVSDAGFGFKCSECGDWEDIEHNPYCPHCGAKVVER